MDQTAQSATDAAIARQINREAGYVVVSTLGVLLLGFGAAILIGRFVGYVLCNIFLLVMFSFALVPAAFMGSPDDYLTSIVSYAVTVAAFSPFMCLGIVLGWRSTVWYDKPKPLILALKVAVFTSFLVVGSTLVVGLVVNLAGIVIGNGVVSLAQFPLPVLLSLPLIFIGGIVIAMPSALICANTYLHLIRPLLLKRGLIVELDLIESTVKHRQQDAVRD